MTLTDHFTRLLTGAALGAAAFVPAIVLSPATAAAGPESPPPCTAGEEVPIPVLGEDGAVVGVNCVPCANLPAGLPGCPPPECDPEVELCEPPACDPETEDCDPPACDPEVEECGEPECDPETEDCDPGSVPEPHPEPVDPPVIARPTFTG